MLESISRSIFAEGEIKCQKYGLAQPQKLVAYVPIQFTWSFMMRGQNWAIGLIFVLFAFLKWERALD